MRKNLLDVFPGIFAHLRSEDKRHCAVDMFVYLYISYHYCLSADNKISLSYRELREGSAIDNGVGFSVDSIRLSIKRLREQGLLRTRKRSRKGQSGKYVFKQEFRPMLPDGSNFTDLAGNQQTQALPVSSTCAENQHINPNGLSGQKLPILEILKTSKPSNVTEQLGSQPFDIYHHLASKLKYALAEKNKLRRKANLAKWSKAIFSFVTSQDNPKQFAKYFEKVLDWYIEHMGDEYIPKVYSANGLCDKFERIEDAMEREITKTLQQEQDEPRPMPPPKEKTLSDEDRQRRRDSMAHLL